MADELLGNPRPPQFTLRALLVVVAVVAMMLGIALPAIRGARDAARAAQCGNNLRTIGLGLHNYYDRCRSFPPAYTSADGQRLHSWRAAILPYLTQWGFEEGDGPPAEISEEKPWNHADNAAIYAWHVQGFYGCPADALGSENNWTNYLAVTGAETAWPRHGALRLEDLPNGAANSILAVETSESHIHWMEPRDLEYDKIELAINGRRTPGISGEHGKGANVLMADASVRWLSAMTSPDALTAMLQAGPGAPESSRREVSEKTEPVAETGKRPPAFVKPLSKAELDKLLARRLDGGMGYTFRQFANMFLVMSRTRLPYGVGLMTSSPEVAQTELQPIFPKFYEPTLREFLDVIALQTSSQWRYDPTSKYFRSDAESGPVEGLALFEFTRAKREKPFEVTPPKGWKAVDKGNWTMYVPPVFPLGMDIHELGTYSSDGKAPEAELLKRVPVEVSLEWARRARDQVDAKELKPAKVGPYDALYFETMMPLRDGSTMRWRQWVFMVGNECYFVVSTILPQLEDRLFPDVQSMLKSFRIKRAPNQSKTTP